MLALHYPFSACILSVFCIFCFFLTFLRAAWAVVVVVVVVVVGEGRAVIRGCRGRGGGGVGDKERG